MQKNIILVGGNSGIGETLLNQLLEKGHNVWAMSREANSIESHSNLQSFSVNILEEDPSFPAIEEAIDALVYCPGSINLKPFNSLKVKDFQADFNINVLGLVKSIQQYLPQLKKAEQSSVVAFSTVAVQTGLAFHASVSSAKGAVEGMMRALAAEMAPKIRFNTIAPSLIETPLSARLLKSDKQREASIQRHPLERIGKRKDIASLAAYLLSEEASWITGQVFKVDGGMSVIKGL